jgi:hypothetical protein
LHGCYEAFELVASIFHVFKEVEACTTGAEEYAVAGYGTGGTGLNAFFHAVGVIYLEPETVEVGV